MSVTDFADKMESLLVINKQCTADVQQVAQDAIKIITGLCEGFHMESKTLTTPLLERLMKAHQDAIDKVQELTQ